MVCVICKEEETIGNMREAEGLWYCIWCLDGQEAYCEVCGVLFYADICEDDPSPLKVRARCKTCEAAYIGAQSLLPLEGVL
jgi:hypothetical protein